MASTIAGEVASHSADSIPDHIFRNEAGFVVTTRRRPIITSREVEELTAEIGITPPEMVFGNSFCQIKHEPSGWEIDFTALEALKRVEKTEEGMLKVAYSEEWQRQRQQLHENINEVVKPFDWTYSTDFTGNSNREFTPCDDPIPIDLLRRPDPIVYFNDVSLYEDELADNGICTYGVKIRIMPERLLLLARFFMRLDHVLFRIRDTRVYIEFATKQVIREYTVREENYADAIAKFRNATPGDLPALTRDSNRVAEILPLVHTVREKLSL